MQQNSFQEIPDGFLKKWQEIADLIAAIINVPAALIMKTENELMEVFTSSNTENNPYKVGDNEKWYGLYCETVIKTQKKLRIPNALKDKNWDKNPDIKLGMIAYLGYPINFPDQKPFGTFCVLDNKERQFSAENEQLLLQFKKVIELDLALIFTLDLKENYSHAGIIQKLSQDNEEYQATNEELKQAEEALRESEMRFQKMLGVVPDMISIQNPEMDILYSNWQGFAGVPKNRQILNTKCYKTYRNFDDICPDCLAKSVLESRKPIHKETRLPDGTWYDIRIIPILDKDHNVEMFMEWVRNITNRKQSEEELKSNYELLQIAGETARLGGWNVNLEKYISHWSDTVADIHEMPHGYAPPVQEGINFYAHEWRKKITQVFTDCAQKGIPYDEEMEIITSKGKRVWVRTIGRALKDENGRISKVHGSFQDITTRKQAEEALQQSEKRYRLLAKNTLDVIWVMTMDAHFTYVNPAIQMMFGFSPDEWIGSGLWEHCDEQHFARMKALIEKETTKGPDQPGVIFETQMIRRDGSTINVEIHGQVIFDEQNVPISLQGVTRDITERKQTEEALKRIEWMLSKKSAAVKSDQAPLYGDLSELNTNGLIHGSVGKKVLEEIANDSLRLLETSSAIYEKKGDYALGIFASGWCRFMDQSSRKLCETDDNKEALNCGKWTCHESCWKEASQPAIESGQPVDIECQGGIHLYALPVIAGEEVVGAINFGYGDPPQDKEKLSELAEKYKVPLDELIKKAKEYQSRPPYIIEMAKDRLQASANLIGEIVSRKIAEREILTLNEKLEQRVIERTAQLEASNKELEAFSYSVSHDLRAPLRHINGYVDLLNKDFHADLPEKAQYYLTTVTDAAKQMGTLIDELLQFSRTGRKEVRKAKIEMNVLVKEVVENIKLETEKREISWKVQKLPQVFADYSLLKQVWVNLLDNAVKFSRNKKPAEISIGFKEEEKYFVFFVRDNGVGFNMKYAHKLFGVFQRLHSQAEFEGTGIGLANVQRIIYRHKGKVWAKAKPGKGATFFFSLPKNKEE
jgi:PAS domain S-box-containing protein